MQFVDNCCIETTQPQKSLDWFRGCVKMEHINKEFICQMYMI